MLLSCIPAVQVEALVGNKPGTVAFALSAMRKKHGIVHTEHKDHGIGALMEALGLSA